MEKRNIGVLAVYQAPDDKPFNFHNMENNGAAQNWLLKHSQEMTPEKLVEEIYQIQQDYADEMMKRRAARRDKNPNDDSSHFKIVEELRDYYGRVAREATMKAMAWLKKNQIKEERTDP